MIREDWLETSWTESQLQSTFLCSAVELFLGAAKSKKCIALSTAQTKDVALSGAAQERIWLKQLEAELGNASKGPTLIFEDNQSAI